MGAKEGCQMLFFKQKDADYGFKNGYLRRLIISYVFLIFLPVFFVGNMLFNYFSSTIDEEVGKSVNELLEQTSEIIDGIISDTRDIYFQMSLNQIATELVQKPAEYFNTYDGIQRSRDIIDVFNNLTETNKYIDSLYIYIDNSRKVITSSNGIIDYEQMPFRDWIDVPIGNGKQVEWIAVKSKDIFQNTVKYYYSFRGQFLRISIPRDMILVNLNVDAVNARISRLKIRETGYVVVTDENGRMLFHKDKKYILGDLESICDKKEIFSRKKGYYIDKIDNRETMVVYTTIEQLGWKEIALIPMSEITGKIDVIKRITFNVTFFVGIIAILLSIFISGRIYKPLRVLVKGMKKAETGDLTVRINDRRKDEFGYLYRIFNNMLVKINELVFDVYKLKLLNKDAELKALQAQINPHFQYNTLNSMYCMAKNKGLNQLSSMIYKLSEYFRISFKPQSEEIEIREEINQIRLYIDIMTIRYVDKFETDIFIDEKLYEYKTIKYIIQPLVENAFHHGMKKRKEKFKLTVHGVCNEERVRFEVSDNGIGITAEKMQSVKRSLDTQSPEIENFALRNISSRIKLLYGEEFGLQIESQQDKGTRVTVTIPLRKI
ncbi:MAG: HAMP domain-containing protein [Ruminiclostridium sp.]|nr:HAMP domain-containing protein [Ruminiclostridium sp.]